MTTTAFNPDSLPLTRLNALTVTHTAFTDFMDMLDAKGGYRPSFYIRRKSPLAQSEIVELANAYDEAQYARGDDRRAYRGDFGLPGHHESPVPNTNL